MSGRSQGRQGIIQIVLSMQIPTHPTCLLQANMQIKLTCVRISICRMPQGISFRGKSLHRGPAPHFQNLIDSRVSLRRNDQTIAWHCAHQVMKLALDHGQVIKDVGVIKLQVIQD